MQATLERLRQRREELGDEGGFTLIELLIVIVVLGILAAIVVFAVQNLTGNSAQASCASDLSTIDHAAQAYVAQTGTAPANETALLGTVQIGTGTGTQVVGPWLRNAVGNSAHYGITWATITAPSGAPDISITVNGPSGGTDNYNPAQETTNQSCSAAGVK